MVYYVAVNFDLAFWNTNMKTVKTIYTNIISALLTEIKIIFYYIFYIYYRVIHFKKFI